MQCDEAKGGGVPPGDQQPRVPTTPKAICFPSGASSAEGKSAKKALGTRPGPGWFS